MQACLPAPQIAPPLPCAVLARASLGFCCRLSMVSTNLVEFAWARQDNHNFNLT